MKGKQEMGSCAPVIKADRGAPSSAIIDRALLARIALLLHTIVGEGLVFDGEDDAWDLFAALGPSLGFDMNYDCDTDLRAMLAAIASPTKTVR